MTKLNSLTVLLVEDSPTDAFLIEKALSQNTSNALFIRKAKDIASALRAVGDAEFDVILLDLSLPDTTKFDGLITLQNMAPKLPIIILTAYAEEETALAAVELGAQDYLFKDQMDNKNIKRAMQFAIQRKRFEGTLITRANFDPLTKLANRLLFESRLDMAMARTKRSGESIGVIFLDLNRFKQVNDTLGHAAGDNLLQEVAHRVRQSVRPYDTVARFGGDEFALLIDGIKQTEDCVNIAQKIIQLGTEPFTILGKQLDIGVSIGITTYQNQDSWSREELIQQADHAMYSAKQLGYSNYQFYNPTMKENVSLFANELKTQKSS